MFASRSTLETLAFDLDATLLNLDLEVNILAKSSIDLVWS
jgi:hypothetical protein